MTVKRLARAKVNLTLRVTGRRPDGYHLLQSLVVFPEIGDTLHFEDAPTLSLVCDGPFAAMIDGEPADNLVIRAARALGPDRFAAIRLTKNLPVASGIGGGSADAAATILGLSELWSLAPSRGTKVNIAQSLGADVPVCLDSRSVVMEGVGDRLSSAPMMPAFWVVLVNPGVPLATRHVFEGLKSFTRSVQYPARFLSVADLVGSLKHAGNDLTAPARALQPEIGDVLSALHHAGARHAAMSGSGATCFAVCATEAEARLLIDRLDAPRSWWTCAASVSDHAGHDETGQVVEPITDGARGQV